MSAQDHQAEAEIVELDLAAVLVRITRERGTSIEHLRAEQLLAEAQLAWPGEPSQMAQKWLAESLHSLGLQAKVTELSRNEALHLAQDGALLVASPAANGQTCDACLILLNYDGHRARVITRDLESSYEISPDQLSDHLGPGANGDLHDGASQAPPREERSWLIVDDLELSHEPSHRFHHRPVRRLLAMIRPEWSDIWVVAVFAFFAGVLGLATPIAVETLVNMVAFGRLLQPLIVLSLMLFAFLTFAGLMRALQWFVVEIIQRRLFVRVAADLAYRFPRITNQATGDSYGPELANRFFDVVTVQKVVANLLIDGMAIVLTTFVGMAVLAFYHPWLLGFDILLLLLVVSGILLLGRGAIAAGIDESKQKYKLAAWLQDVMRCRLGFKTSGAAEFALDRANYITASYLACRRKHFRVLFRQLLFIIALQAIAGTVLLGFGGWLVIRGQLTLGQLVAAELIVATILSSMAKLGKHIESFYDLIAAVDKLGHLFDLEMESQDGLLALAPNDGARLRVTDVTHDAGGEWLAGGVSLEMNAGDQLALLGPSQTGSSTLLDMLFGLCSPRRGHVEIEHADPRDLRPDVLRRAVTLVREIEVFEGTVSENIQLGRPSISMTDVRGALHAVGLLDDILRLPDGLDTVLNARGLPLVGTQLNLLMLARAIVGQPSLLLIDGTLDGLDDADLARVASTLTDAERCWTLIVATRREKVAAFLPKAIVTTASQNNSAPTARRQGDE